MIIDRALSNTFAGIRLSDVVPFICPSFSAVASYALESNQRQP
jgi:hypothetical protein